MAKNARGRELSIGALRECLRPDYVNGQVFWLRRPLSQFATAKGCRIFNAKYPGKEALASKTGDGHCESIITMHGERHWVSRSRVIWALFHGRWPSHDLGHRNGDPSDDRPENLREQLRSETTAMRRKRNGEFGIQSRD